MLSKPLALAIVWIDSPLAELAITLFATIFLYLVLFYILRFWFRKLETDIPLVTLTVSKNPILVFLIFLSLKLGLDGILSPDLGPWLQRLLTVGIIASLSFWFATLSTEVITYYLKKLAQQTEVMWDDVLIPLLESIIPVFTYFFGGALVIQSFGVDLTGIWVAFGGVTFILGFALKDILSNFFSGLVLFIDTPFQFGDVVRINKEAVAVIKEIGLRTTKLYLFETHSEIYVPNSRLESQDIVNLSRPSNHYYYSINLEMRADADPFRAQTLLTEVVLAHPDTLGDIDHKLQHVDRFYDSNTLRASQASKKSTGRTRLLAEKRMNACIEDIEQALESLSVTIKFIERGGLDREERDTIQEEHLQILKSIGLASEIEPLPSRKKGIKLQETQENDSLIMLTREWYRSWLQDPDLLNEDQYILPEEWERRIELLKRRSTRLTERIFNADRYETRLDDNVIELANWLRERFKQSRHEWQEPKVWMTDMRMKKSGEVGHTDLTVKFYVDNIRLEHCQRGDRVKSEVRRELTRQLRQAYLYA